MIAILATMIAIAMTDPLVAHTDRMGSAWVPSPRPVRSEWCEQNLWIPPETGATPGRFELDGHVYLREILDCVDDPGIKKITIIGASQWGKTELIRAVALSQSEVARAPMMLAGPDELYAVEQRDEIYRRALASPALRGRVPAPRDWNKRQIDLEKSLIYLAWSGSAQRMSGRACRVVLASEADRWQKSVAFVEERVKAFPGGTIVIVEGTPVDASPYLETSYQQSDRRTFRVPCPKCGHFQELRMFPHRHGPYAGNGGVSGMKDATGKWLTPNEARTNAFYLCEKGCRVEPEQKNGMVRLGKWARDGEEITKAGTAKGQPKNPGRHAGFRGTSLMSKTISIGDMAEKWLTVRDNQEQLCRFWNDWLGMAFKPRGTTPRWRDLGIRLAGSYPRGAVPKFAYFLTAGVDVQLRGVYWIVRAWGDRKTSALVQFGYLPKELLGAIDDETNLSEEKYGSDIAKLDAAILDRRWPIDGTNPRGLSALAARVMGVDRGYRSGEVDAFLAAHPGTRVLAVFGDPHITAGSLYRPMKVKRDVRTGRLQDEDPRTWGIDTNAFKSEIADRWMADRTQPGAWWLPSDILETDGGEDYLRQITAETRSIETLNGRKVLRWELITHERPNHYFDCEVYASAIADMVVGGDWDANNWATPARPKLTLPQVQPVREGQEGFSAR